MSLLKYQNNASIAPLPQAAVDNDTEKIKTLVNRGTNINEIYKLTKLRPDLYCTALWAAVDKYNHEAVKILLELGEDLYAQTDEEKALQFYKQAIKLYTNK